MSMLELLRNPAAGRRVLPDWCGEENFRAVRAFHESLPGYAPTPLVSLPALAAELGVGAICLKDESLRFGLNAFKALGASYALHRLRSGRPREPFLAVTATDGNHGRGVAWAARRLGGRAAVFMPAGTVSDRVEAIRAIGDTRVTVTGENYDGTIAIAADYARTHGGTLVQDTALPGYEDIPRDITLGYSTMAAEALEQLTALGAGEPTHVFLQAGVGSMAGGVTAFLAEACQAPPVIAVAEAWDCACVLESIRQGKSVTIEGLAATSMAGLNCGTPNSQTLPVLREWAQWFLRCRDEVTFRAMCRLAHPGPGETAVVSGESGAAGLGCLMALMERPELAAERAAMGLGRDSVVLLFSTEGDTDPDHYRAVLAAGY